MRFSFFTVAVVASATLSITENNCFVRSALLIATNDDHHGSNKFSQTSSR